MESILTLAVQPLQEFMASHTIANDHLGIYLSTNTSGKMESVAFWKESLIKTPSFVNPAIFPWTLPNAAAARLAYLLQVTGPVYTFLGTSDQHQVPLKTAYMDWKKKQIQFALIVELDVEETILNLNLRVIHPEAIMVE